MQGCANSMGRIVAGLIVGIAIGAGILFAVDFLIGRPAGFLCSATGLCQSRNLPVPRNIYVPDVERVQALSQLTTTRYNYANIVTGQTQMPSFLDRLYGESLIMVAVVRIDAGIDVSNITEEDILYDAETETVTITLPAPTLQDCFLDEGESYIAQRQTGVFAQPSTNIDTATRRYALAQFRDQALEEGILADAANEAVAVVQEFLETTSEAQFVVLIDPTTQDAPLPETCQ